MDKVPCSEFNASNDTLETGAKVFQIGDLPAWAQAAAIPIVFVIALLTIVQLSRVNSKLRLEQENLRLENEERRHKLEAARASGNVADLGEAVEGLAVPLMRSNEAIFLLIRFLFLSLLLTFAGAVQSVVVSVGYGVVQIGAWAIEQFHGVDAINSSTLLMAGSGLAGIVQIVASGVILAIAMAFGWPLYKDVRAFLANGGRLRS